MIWFKKAGAHPARLIVTSFLLVIGLGTFLLWLPVSVSDGRPLKLVDAFFTAASATCVTGLTVFPVGEKLSLFGQLVLLACIQVGGLGLVTFTTIFLVASGKRLAIAERTAIQDTFQYERDTQLRTLLLYVVRSTLLIEGLGALALTIAWSRQGLFPSIWQTAYYAVFHSVSAFCNAGFSLFPDSLIRFRSDTFVLLSFCALIVSGGLGFIVGFDLWRAFRQVIQNFGPARRRAGEPRRLPRLSVQTRLVVLTTAVLLAFGTLTILLLERGGVFRTMTLGDALLNAFFCSVTPRTAGFNTVDYAAMGGPALAWTMMLMFLGASPGSTGGGIKTSTFALMVANSWSSIRGELRLNLFKRTIPQETVAKASSVIMAAAITVVLAATALMTLEHWGTGPQESQRNLLPLLFETISAFGTVGLSLGITETLTSPGKLLLVLVMLIGRIGPLTLGIAISMRRRRPLYEYAKENVMVG